MGVLITEGYQLDSRFCSHILKKTPFEGDKNNLTIQSIFRSMNKPNTHKMMNQPQLSISGYRALTKFLFRSTECKDVKLFNMKA